MKSLNYFIYLGLLFGFTGAAWSQNITNPSFELNHFNNGVGYASQNGNGIIGWTISDPTRIGLNIGGSNNPTLLVNNGAIPDGTNVAFIQATSGTTNTLSTLVTGLIAGRSYRVSFRANHRSLYTDAGNQAWSLNGGAFMPFTASPPVGGTNAYYFNSATFTATSSSAALVLRNGIASGDSTVMLDDFSVVNLLQVTSASDGGAGSLRQVMASAPANSIISFAPALSGATLTLTNEIVPENNVSIDASSLPAGLILSGGNAHRIFYVTNGIQLTLTGLTLTKGTSVTGGAILNYLGTLTMNQCTLTGNSSPSGGGIFSEFGTVILTNCTLATNSATVSSGAIYNYNGTTVLTHCTLAGNSAVSGGAIDNYLTTLTLTACIFSGNTASSGTGPNLYMENGTPIANNCLFDDGKDSAVINGMNGNLVGNSVYPTNALLAPLDNYGGPTQTMPLLAGSPAINAGGNGAGLATDQRGYPRFSGSAADIGATEYQQVVVQNAGNSAAGSLRVALATADSITFASALSGTTLYLSSEMSLNRNVIIDASSLPGGLTLDGNASRIFYINTNQTILLRGLTFTDGQGAGALYGGSGGAMFNDQGNLTLDRCTLTGNSANYGGAIYSLYGSVMLTNCTFANNSVTSRGGAIANLGGAVTLTACTLALNHSTGPSDGDGGGAIYSSSQLTLTDCILASNTAVSGFGPDLWMESNALTANNCLISIGDDSPFADGENGNQVGDSSAPLNAMLAPLGNYGGGTQTMPLLAGSPAIDAGGANFPLATDQRGFSRVSGSAVDIGAVEYQQIVVQNTNDSGAGSLRTAAVMADSITFTSNLSGTTILLTGSEIPLSGHVMIDASSLPGGLTISGGGSTRLFSISSGQTAAFTGLTFTGGYVSGTATNIYGGAILNSGTLSLSRCNLAGNKTATAGGGAIANVSSGALTLTQCTLASNTASYGGACYNEGTLTLVNSTLANNSANFGGALLNNSGTLTLNQCTVALNQSIGSPGLGGGGGGIRQYGSATTILINSVLAGNTDITATAPDFWNEGATATATHSLISIGDGSTITDGANGNHIGTSSSPIDALLAPIGNYGGSTQSMPPQTGSPAIDAGGSTLLTTDQRGYPRLFGGAVDIGAVEVQPAMTNILPVLANVQLANHNFQFTFTGTPGTVFRVVTTTNLTLPLANWTALGAATETSSGHYQFSQTGVINPAQFYRVVSP